MGADLEMPVRVLEAGEKVEQIDGAQFFNPAAVVAMSGWLWALCSLPRCALRLALSTVKRKILQTEMSVFP